MPSFRPCGGDVDLRLDSSGTIVRLKDESTLEEYDFGVGRPRTSLWFQRCQIGGKTVIYIFPKEEQDLSCRLELVPECEHRFAVCEKPYVLPRNLISGEDGERGRAEVLEPSDRRLFDSRVLALSVASGDRS